MVQLFPLAAACTLVFLSLGGCAAVGVVGTAASLTAGAASTAVSVASTTVSVGASAVSTTGSLAAGGAGAIVRMATPSQPVAGQAGPGEVAAVSLD